MVEDYIPYYGSTATDNTNCCIAFLFTSTHLLSSQSTIFDPFGRVASFCALYFRLFVLFFFYYTINLSLRASHSVTAAIIPRVSGNHTTLENTQRFLETAHKYNLYRLSSIHANLVQFSSSHFSWLHRWVNKIQSHNWAIKSTYIIREPEYHHHYCLLNTALVLLLLIT